LVQLNDTSMFLRLGLSILVASVFGLTGLAYALDPAEILVVANGRMKESVEIAQYYMERRGIPGSHLLIVSLSFGETMSREEYDRVLKSEVLHALNSLQPIHRIAAVVLIYGIPLKVEPPKPSRGEDEELHQYQQKLDAVSHDPDMKGEKGEGRKADLLRTLDSLRKTGQRAAVDSELALAKAGDYSLDGWIRNPYFLGFQGLPPTVGKDQVLLVSRLDGPDAPTVYRLIKDTLLAEAEGLHGKAYFDARWPQPENPDLSGYARYDLSLHRAAKIAAARMTTLVDDKQELFAESCCPDAALYCGWYSLGRYIDSFSWQKGAIGYHIASAECATLRGKNSSGWCVKMLEKGAAATIGPVYEPYVQGFPLPELFFAQLIEGDMSLGESYLVALPYLSWQMVLVGDPLYQPFPRQR